MRKAGQGENDDSLEGRNCRAAEAFPVTIADLLTGAASISRRNPNSRSRAMEAAEKMAVNSTVGSSYPATLADPEVGFARASPGR